MATTYTTNVGLGIPAVSDRLWNLAMEADLRLLDAQNAIGDLCVSLAESPSASLNVRVAGGVFRSPWGSKVSYAGTAGIAMTASVTNSIYLTPTGTLTVSTTGYPGTAHVPLATVVAGASTITSITDDRVPFSCVIPIAQPTMGAATAGATYTAAEQSMLQNLWDAVRALGLGT